MASPFYCINPSLKEAWQIIPFVPVLPAGAQVHRFAP